MPQGDRAGAHRVASQGRDWSRYPEGTGDGSRTELTARAKVRLGRQLLGWTVGKPFQYLNARRSEWIHVRVKP